MMTSDSKGRSPFGLAGLGLMVALALTACGPFGKPDITTPADTSASNLDVTFSLSATQYPDKLSVGAIFFYQGVFVRFARGEHVVCNGVTLNFTTNTFGAYIPNVAANHTVACSYIDAKDITTTIAFAMVKQPIITYPTEGATIVRSKTFTVTYVPQQAKQLQFDAGTFTKPTSIDLIPSCFTQQTTGSLACDVTTTHAGKGQITLDAESDDMLTNSGFHSASTSSVAYTRLNVTWL